MIFWINHFWGHKCWTISHDNWLYSLSCAAMASQHQLADPCLRPLKRLRTSSEGPKVDPECHGSYQESPIDDSNAFDCLDGKFKGRFYEKCCWYLAFWLKKSRWRRLFSKCKVRTSRCVISIWAESAVRLWSARFFFFVQVNFLVTTSTNVKWLTCLEQKFVKNIFFRRFMIDSRWYVNRNENEKCNKMTNNFLTYNYYLYYCY